MTGGRQSRRRRLAGLALAALAGAAAVAIASELVRPGPPSRLVIAAGRPDGAYYRFALRYRELLRQQGITLEVRPTSGAAENLQLLADRASGVDVAFAQGGVRPPRAGAEVEALGSLYYEPIWLVTRDAGRRGAGYTFTGRRLAIGPAGSGTREIAEIVLDAAGIGERAATRLPLTGLDAARALEEGKVDAVFLIASPESPALQAVVRIPGASLATVPKAAAYARRFPFLTTLVLPEGTLDIPADIPPRETLLLATTAALAVRSDFHPALANLLLVTAAGVHGGRGIFERRGEFPSADHLDLPLAEAARRYHESGPPLLIRHLPFSVAMLLDRLKLLLPLLPIAIGLYQFLPSLYRGRVRSRICRWYRDVQAVDLALASRPPAGALGELLAEVERIDDGVRRLRVPLGYEELRYQLRMHVDLVRQRVKAALAEAADGPRVPRDPREPGKPQDAGREAAAR